MTVSGCTETPLPQIQICTCGPCEGRLLQTHALPNSARVCQQVRCFHVFPEAVQMLYTVVRCSLQISLLVLCVPHYLILFASLLLDFLYSPLLHQSPHWSHSSSHLHSSH